MMAQCRSIHLHEFRHCCVVAIKQRKEYIRSEVSPYMKSNIPQRIIVGFQQLTSNREVICCELLDGGD